MWLVIEAAYVILVTHIIWQAVLTFNHFNLLVSIFMLLVLIF